MATLSRLLKNFVARLAYFIRKLFDFPRHMFFFVKKTWEYWIRQAKLLWKYAEVAEYFEITFISIQLMLLAIKEGWKKMKRDIMNRNQCRYQTAGAGHGSWIDRQIYFGDGNE